MSAARDPKDSWYDWAREQTDPATGLPANRKPWMTSWSWMSAMAMWGGWCAPPCWRNWAPRSSASNPRPAMWPGITAPSASRIRRPDSGYLAEGRNKYHITLDLQKPASREIFTTLAKHADVIIETYQPGVMDGWGLGYRQLRESQSPLDLCRLRHLRTIWTPGRSGRPGSEITNQAYSGLVHINGEPEHLEPTEHGVPTKVGSWYGWYAEGMFAAYGILLALNFRTDTGQGQMVDVSGAECIMKFIDYNLSWFHMDGKVKSRLGNYDIAVFPYTFIRCKEGYTFLAAYNDEAFETLMEIIERPEMSQDPRFSSFQKRTSVENEEALQFLLEEWSLRYPVDEVIQRVQEAISKKEGRAAAVVTGKVTQPADVIQEQNWWDRGVFQKVQRSYLWRAHPAGTGVENEPNATAAQMALPSHRRR